MIGEAIAEIKSNDNDLVKSFSQQSGIEDIPNQYADDVVALLFASMSKATRRAYSVQCRNFANFALSIGAQYLPASPETVAAYISMLVSAKKSVATITQTLAAIRAAHLLSNNTDPTVAPLVRKVNAGARRTLGIAPRKKVAATDSVIRELVAALDRSTLQGKRDAAVILLGFWGAFRRSELVALDIEDFQPATSSNGRAAYLVTVRRSKTDQEGAGMTKGIFATRSRELDPVSAVADYVKTAGITSGPLFRRIVRGDHIQTTRITAHSVALIIKAAAIHANVSADLSGHSLRSGFITSAISNGLSERSIMNQTGHKSPTVMRSYQQRESALSDNAASGLAATL